MERKKVTEEKVRVRVEGAKKRTRKRNERGEEGEEKGKKNR